MLEAVLRYHDATKHHFARFAASLGYLDWASQPGPFRGYHGAPRVALPREPVAPDLPYDALFDGRECPAQPLSVATLADFLRCAMGLSAWKQLGRSRWSLRVNPSSGNLHPTETYVVARAVDVEGPAVYHYMPDEHALERRAALAIPGEAVSDRVFLVALSSIHWREAWKYGERAFRYCQHDTGHAIAALSLSARRLGWRLALIPGWSDASIGALLGLDRDDDFFEAEREEPQCLMRVDASGGPSDGATVADPRPFVAAARAATWTGRASQLSEDHVEWSIITDVTNATRAPGAGASAFLRRATDDIVGPRGSGLGARRQQVAPARQLFLQRRSALDFDGLTSIPVDAFALMLARTMPSTAAPWDALWWDPRVHLALFVHRVDGFPPGLYVLVRDVEASPRLRDAMQRELLWERVQVLHNLALYRLAEGDCRRLATRLCCDQPIGGDGVFSLGMIAELEPALERYGPWFYRNLFWEAGFVGQILYLEAEAAGVRSTGIGCYYDDPVHELLGLTDHAFQSLYHFTVGFPVEDARLTTEPGYSWERKSTSTPT